ncbi:MAG: alpha/beta hydrolase [Planctomycetota bacterium]
MRRRWWRVAAKAAVVVTAVWLAGDFAYSRVVAGQADAWEATVQRDADGVLDGCGAYSLEPTTAASPGKPALLMVHGINASPRHYDKLAPHMAGLGYPCRVTRLPGFAEPLDAYAGHNAGDWVAAVDRELAGLRDEHERVGIVAHSLGGAVAIGQLLAEPGSADFAVLLAPATGVSSRRSPILSTRAWHEVGRKTLPFTTVMRSPFGIDSHDPANADFPGRCPFTPRVVVDELFGLMDANWRGVSRFDTPLLMVLTEDDRVVDWEAARRFYEECPSPRKELLMLEDSGHAIPVDYGWREVAAAVDRFATADDR